MTKSINILGRRKKRRNPFHAAGPQSSKRSEAQSMVRLPKWEEKYVATCGQNPDASNQTDKKKTPSTNETQEPPLFANQFRGQNQSVGKYKQDENYSQPFKTKHTVCSNDLSNISTNSQEPEKLKTHQLKQKGISNIPSLTSHKICTFAFVAP